MRGDPITPSKQLPVPSLHYHTRSARQCRIWSLADGSELAALRGHTGRGVWRIAIADDCIATAGADASIKLWSLSQSCSGTSRGPSLQAPPPHETSAEGTGEVARVVSENGGGGQETLHGQGCEGGQGGGGSSDGVVTLAHCPHPSRDDDAPRDASGATLTAH